MQKHIVVIGKVQKVGFRKAVKDVARELNVKGFVKNDPYDERKVIIVGEFDDNDHLQEFLDAIKNINTLARVEEIIVKDVKKKRTFTRFRIVRTVEEIGERFDEAVVYLKQLVQLVEITKNGFARLENKLDSMNKKLDVMNNKLDVMNEKLDNINNKLDTMNKKMDTMNNKLDNIENKIDEMNKNMCERFDRLDTKYGKISKQMGEIAEYLKGLIMFVQKEKEKPNV